MLRCGAAVRGSGWVDLILRVLITAFRITGHFSVFLVQVGVYIWRGKDIKKHIAEAFGHFGRASVEAIAAAMERSHLALRVQLFLSSGTLAGMSCS